MAVPLASRPPLSGRTLRPDSSPDPHSPPLVIEIDFHHSMDCLKERRTGQRSKGPVALDRRVSTEHHKVHYRLYYTAESDIPQRRLY